MRTPVPWATILLFGHVEVRAAIEHAQRGGVALHVWVPDPNFEWRHAPMVFRKNMARWAHLFDLDTERLRRVARELGIKTIYVDRAGTPKQHIDLCGAPLERAIARAVKAPTSASSR